MARRKNARDMETDLRGIWVINVLLYYLSLAITTV